MNTVTTRFCAHIHNGIASAGSTTKLKVACFHKANTHHVYQRISLVRLVKRNFATNRWYADAVAVACNALNNLLKQIGGTCVIKRRKTQRIENSNGARAHTKDVAQNAANASSCAFVRLNRRRMIVTFGLKHHRQAVTNVYHARTFARTLNNARSFGGKRAQHGFGVFVRAVLAPHNGKQPALRIVRQPA